MNYAHSITPYQESKSIGGFEEFYSEENKKRRAEDNKRLDKFMRELLLMQPDGMTGFIKILFNKARYIEFTPPTKELLRYIAQSAKVKIRYNNMIVCGTEKIEAVVKALNKKDIFVYVNLDWI